MYNAHWIHSLPYSKFIELTLFKLTDYKEAYEKADIVVFLVAHSVFKSLPYNDRKVIFDFCGIYKK